MVVGQDVSVVASGSDGTRHLIDNAIGDEYLEIAVDGAERERRGFRHQRAMDLRCGRM